jgi:leader peptidase (prepilin peptidase)/N-methyltransferase
VLVPGWIWLFFTFAFGCCVGSFLNVVIYRLPLDKSLVSPRSFCPACGRGIAFYDNIPLISWLLLGRKCRYCKAAISPRYFIVELLGGLIFASLFHFYFCADILAGAGSFRQGGWLIYLLHIILLAAFLAASAVDMELWVIPLSICWFVTAAGLIGSFAAPYVIEPKIIAQYYLLPSAGAGSGILAIGAALGLFLSLALLRANIVKRSYESKAGGEPAEESEKPDLEPDFNHRVEMYKEVVFLLPIVAGAAIAFAIERKNPAIHSWWVDFLSKNPPIAGFLGSLWGYFAGCSVVWATRVLGTLAFGKEAMGLGDVHLMGAAGAVIGPVLAIIAFFVAPFFGLIWTGFQMFFKKTRQIPYGPFLSLGVFTVMILHDRIFSYINFIFFR